MKRERMYGMMAEFDSATALVEAARRTHQAGYKKIDAYSPFPIEGLAEEIGFHHDEVPLVVLIGGIIGGCTGVHRDHVRDDDSVCRHFRGVRHACVERLAHALPSCIQRSTLCAGFKRPFLPDRVFFRSEVRSGGHVRFSAGARAALDFGGAELGCRASARFRCQYWEQRP